MNEPHGVILGDVRPPVKHSMRQSNQHQISQMQVVHPLRVVLDVFVLFCVFLPVAVFALAVTPYKRGFYCDDDSIYYPYKDSTVENIILYIFGLGIPIVTILIVEAYRTYVFEPKCLNCKPEPTICIRSKPCNVYLTRLYYYIGYFMFGAALCQTLTDIGKYSIGRLRPHFISACQPDLLTLNCTNHNYVVDFQCNGDPKVVRESRLSFPSGHSSFGFYSMMFGVYYLHAQLGWPIVSRLVKNLIQFSFICIAVSTALSRISDYKHHWSDVLSGSILGIVVSTIVAIYVAKLFTHPKQALYHYHGIEAPNVQVLQQMVVGSQSTQTG